MLLLKIASVLGLLFVFALFQSFLLRLLCQYVLLVWLEGGKMEKILNSKKYTSRPGVTGTLRSKMFFFFTSPSLVLFFISIALDSLEYFQLNFTSLKDFRERRAGFS